MIKNIFVHVSMSTRTNIKKSMWLNIEIKLVLTMRKSVNMITEMYITMFLTIKWKSNIIMNRNKIQVEIETEIHSKI